MSESKCFRITFSAYEAGFHMINGECYSPYGTRLSTNNRNANGYIQASHRMNGKTAVFLVHRLAAIQYFGDEFINNPTINVIHLDGDPTNNLKENLALGDRQAVSMNIPAKRRSKRGRPNALTDEQVLRVKGIFAPYKGVKLPKGFIIELSKKLNVSYYVISKIRYGESFKHL